MSARGWVAAAWALVAAGAVTLLVVVCSAKPSDRNRVVRTERLASRVERSTESCDIAGVCLSCMNVGPAYDFRRGFVLELGKPACSVRYRLDCYEGRRSVVRRFHEERVFYGSGSHEVRTVEDGVENGACVR